MNDEHSLGEEAEGSETVRPIPASTNLAAPTRSRTFERRPSVLRSKGRYHPAALTFSGAIQPFIASDVAFLADSEWSSRTWQMESDGDDDLASISTSPSSPFPSSARRKSFIDYLAGAFTTTDTASVLEERLEPPLTTPTSLFGLSVPHVAEPESLEIEGVSSEQLPSVRPTLSRPAPQPTTTAPRNFPSRAPIFVPRVKGWQGFKDLLRSRRNIHTLRAVVSLLVMLIVIVLVQPVADWFGPESFFSVFVVALWDFTLTVGGSVTMLWIAWLMCATAAGAVCLTVALCSIGSATLNAAGVLILLFVFSFGLWFLLAYQPNIFPPFFSSASIVYFGIVNSILVVGHEITTSIDGKVVTTTGTPEDAYRYSAKMAIGICMTSFVSCLSNLVISPVTAGQRLHQELGHTLGNISFIFGKIVESRARRLKTSESKERFEAESARIRILLQSLRFDFLTASRILSDAQTEFTLRTFDAAKYSLLLNDLQDVTTQLASLNACLDGFNTPLSRQGRSDTARYDEAVLIDLDSAVEASLAEIRSCVISHKPSKTPCSCIFPSDLEDEDVLEQFLSWSVKKQQLLSPDEIGKDSSATARTMAGYLFAFGTKELVGTISRCRKHLRDLHAVPSSSSFILRRPTMPMIQLSSVQAMAHKVDEDQDFQEPPAPVQDGAPEEQPRFSLASVGQKLWKFSLWMRTWEARFAFKFSVAVCFVTMFALIPTTRAGFYDWRVKWAGITIYAAAAPTHSGDISNSLQRTAGTIIGVLLGIACWYISGTNPYITAVVSFVFWYPACWVKHSGLPEWTKTGALSAATYTILFNHLELVNMGFTDIESVWIIGGKRALMVIVGVFIVMAVGRFIWPSLARVQLRRSLSDTVDGLSWLFRQVAGMFMLASAGEYDWNSAESVVEEVESVLQTSLIQERVLVALSLSEPRFRGPFPHQTFLDLVRTAQQILDMLRFARLSLAEFKHIAPIDPKVLHVEDADRISRTRALVMLSWMTAKSLRVHTSLPYYLPDCSSPQRRLNAALLKDANAILATRPAYLAYGAYSSAVTEAVFGFQVLADLVAQLYGKGDGVIGQTDQEEWNDLTVPLKGISISGSEI